MSVVSAYFFKILYLVLASHNQHPFTAEIVGACQWWTLASGGLARRKRFIVLDGVCSSSSDSSQFQGCDLYSECVDFAGIQLPLAKMSHWTVISGGCDLLLHGIDHNFMNEVSGAKRKGYTGALSA